MLHPCPPWCPRPRECIEAGNCVVVRLRLKEGDVLIGIPAGIVGETLRFRQLLPSRGMVLLPFGSYATLPPEAVPSTG